ncbi:pentapeptide repeat-containing protein [Duganella sp. sic0402]|uniref:pentapeptide repeat-containing protein n=1 Tax=Duganella sp. sic0402 TaxID=2854786 RepID=UPI001C45B611|nr:pentapeptide repeat-containing protein [Duganella sp. sic0402]MBV7534692.1 pentapeptide repeat-containing protein [Duganella sp. sic0402]
MTEYYFFGAFIASTEAMKKTYYLTLAGSEVRLTTEVSKAMAVRLYQGVKSDFMLTCHTPVTIKQREGAFMIDLPSQGSVGVGNLVFDRQPVTSVFEDCRIDNTGGSAWIRIGESWLGASAGHDKDESLLYLHPTTNPFFKPAAWQFTPVDAEKALDLRYVNLEDHFACLNAPKAKLQYARLDRAHMYPCDLTSADLSKSSNIGTTYGSKDSAAKLANSIWAGAVCWSTDFTCCDLRGAKFVDAVFRDRGEDVDPPYLSFVKADLRGADLSKCDLRGANFSGAMLSGADLSGSKLDRCVVNSADFCGADLSGVDLTTVKFDIKLMPRFSVDTPNSKTPLTKLIGAKLNADLIGLKWDCLDLSNATVSDLPKKLDNLSAQYALIPKMDLSKRSLTKANFRFATLGKVNFSGANLTEANLSGLDLTKAEFTNAVMSATLIQGTNLKDRDLSTVSCLQRPITSKDTTQRTNLAGTSFKAGMFRKDWTALDLTGAKISDLATTDLTALQADDVILIDVDLKGAKFNSVTEGKDIIGASFQRALFHGADLKYVEFQNAILTGAQFGMYKVISRTSLAHIGQADVAALSQRMSEQIEQEAGAVPLIRSERRADGHYELLALVPTQHAYLNSAYLVNVNLTNANLEGVDAEGAHLYGPECKLEGAVLTQIKLANANLASADLSRVILQGADLSSANLIGTKFKGADLSPVPGVSIATKLSKAHLAEADFTDAKLQGVNFDGAAIPSTNGVYLFTLEKAFLTELQASKIKNETDIPPPIGKSFDQKLVENRHLKLGPKAKIKGNLKSWRINDSEDRVQGYASYVLLENSDKVDVFAKDIKIQRLGLNNQLEIVQNTLLPATAFHRNNMDEKTRLPDGELLGQRKDWDERWLRATAAMLPKPPTCIPSQKHYCPLSVE